MRLLLVSSCDQWLVGLETDRKLVTLTSRSEANAGESMP